MCAHKHVHDVQSKSEAGNAARAWTAFVGLNEPRPIFDCKAGPSVSDDEEGGGGVASDVDVDLARAPELESVSDEVGGNLIDPFGRPHAVDWARRVNDDVGSSVLVGGGLE